MKNDSTLIAEKLALETTCLRLSRDLAVARYRISQLENEVAAFKRNNRYLRGHTAGYEEAKKKYHTQ